MNIKNADMPAMPLTKVTTKGTYKGLDTFDVVDAYEGLTKREIFAMHAMQGLLTCTMDTDCSIPELCADAVIAADALLSELEKTK